MTEFFDIINESDKVIGKAARHECHGNPKLLHRSAGVLVFNSKGELLMQKRSVNVDTNPGKWTISAWGHPGLGESYEHTAMRETKEELGVKAGGLKQLFKIIYRDEVESEMFCMFRAESDGPFRIDKKEVDEVKFMSLGEIRRHIRDGTGMFTGGCLAVLEEYFRRFKQHVAG